MHTHTHKRSGKVQIKILEKNEPGKKQSVRLLPWKPSISRIRYENRKRWLCFLTAKETKRNRMDDSVREYIHQNVHTKTG